MVYVCSSGICVSECVSTCVHCNTLRKTQLFPSTDARPLYSKRQEIRSIFFAIERISFVLQRGVAAHALLLLGQVRAFCTGQNNCTPPHQCNRSKSTRPKSSAVYHISFPAQMQEMCPSVLCIKSRSTRIATWPSTDGGSAWDVGFALGSSAPSLAPLHHSCAVSRSDKVPQGHVQSRISTQWRARR